MEGYALIKAVLCDIDGTLVESNWLHAQAWQEAFAEMGISVDRETVRRQIGKGGDELIPVFVPWWRRAAVAEPLKVLRAHVFESEYMGKVQPLPGARMFLEALKERGIRVGLASSASKRDLLRYKELVGIEEVVDTETSASDTEKAKPHPDIFSAALGRLGLKASEVLAIGDTPYDAEAAGLAGIGTVGVETGGWTREELLEAGCLEVYTSVDELRQRLGESLLLR